MTWRKPWFCVCKQQTCLHRSLIVKSQQNSIELVTRPGLKKIYKTPFFHHSETTVTVEPSSLTWPLTPSWSPHPSCQNSLPTPSPQSSSRPPPTRCGARCSPWPGLQRGDAWSQGHPLESSRCGTDSPSTLKPFYRWCTVHTVKSCAKSYLQNWLMIYIAFLLLLSTNHLYFLKVFSFVFNILVFLPYMIKCHDSWFLVCHHHHH